MFSTGKSATLLVRLAAPFLLAAGLNACSSVPDWVDPTTWIGGDSQSTNEQTVTSPDTAQNSGDQSQDASQTPDLASIPSKPTPPSTSEEQGQVADSLSADRARAQYSQDALRGGTEPAASPPPPAQPPSADANSPAPAKAQTQAASSDSSSAQSSDADQPAESANPPVSAASSGSEAQTTSTPESETSTATNAPVSSPPPPSNEVASTGSAAPPATPPLATDNTTGTSGGNMEVMFAPSKAPALDPSVSQFVPQPILARYRQTAAAAATPGVSGNETASGSPTKHRHRKKTKTSDAAEPAKVASMDATRAADPALQPASFVAGPAGILSGSGASLAAIVQFPEDTTVLDREARDQVKSVALEFAAGDGQGYVRVVGYSSSRDSKLSLARRQALDFQRSEARASAVARELIRAGVPPDRVLVEAVGDSHPGYAGSWPGSGGGNRRAEIFLQS